MLPLHLSNQSRQVSAALLALAVTILLAGLLAFGSGTEPATPIDSVEIHTIDSVTARLLLDHSLGTGR